MNTFKSLLLFLQELMNPHSDLRSFVAEMTDVISLKVQDLLLNVGLKLLVGFILSGTILYSLISMGEQINFLLLNLENGPYVSLILFLLLMLVSIALLIYFLKRPATSPLPPPTAIPPNSSNELTLALEKLLIIFIQGLTEGLEKSRQQSAVPEPVGVTPQSPPSEPARSDIKTSPEETGEMP